MTVNAAPPPAAAGSLVARDAAPQICQPPGEDIGDPRRWAILALLLTVAFVAQLGFFVVNAAMVPISADFGGANLSAVSWLLNVYAIVFASMLVPAGRIRSCADLFRRLGGVRAGQRPVQAAWRFSPLQAGLEMAPAALAAAAVALCAGPIATRFGPTVPAVVAQR
jgi:hypothetical protein